LSILQLNRNAGIEIRRLTQTPLQLFERYSQQCRDNARSGHKRATQCA
jgi:hypothetical protein